MINPGILIKALLVASGLFSVGVGAQQMPPAFVNVVKAQIKPLAPVAWVSGTLVSSNDSHLAAEVPGRIVRLAELGTQVKKGDLLAQIDDSSLQIQRQEDMANLAKARSRLAFLASEVKRKSSLAKRNLSAKTDLDETISLRDAAQADLSVAQARLAKTEQDLSFARLKAPFDGLVTERLSNHGEYIKSGTAIIHLVETSNLQASVFVPLTAYQFLKQTPSLQVESPLGKGIAKIVSLIPVADSRSHLMQVRLDMSGFDWPVGLDLRVAIASGESKPVLAVPRDALVLRRQGVSIFRVNEQSAAEQVAVKVGIGAGQWVEVSGKLKAGERIIVRGAERLQPGQKVQVKPDNTQLISGEGQD